MGERLVRNQKVVSSILIPSTTSLKPDQFSGFFHIRRNANTGGASGFRAKGGIRQYTPNFTVFCLSALSVLCFCEGRPSHDPPYPRGFPASNMNGNLLFRGDTAFSAPVLRNHLPL